MTPSAIDTENIILVLQPIQEALYILIALSVIALYPIIKGVIKEWFY